MEYLKVDGYNNLIRDAKTNSIINTNMNEYREYILRRDAKNEEDQKIQHLEENIANIKNDLEEIKMLLRGLKNES
jgi:hypothetical protein